MQDKWIIRILSGTQVYVVCHRDQEFRNRDNLMRDCRWIGKSYRRAHFQKWLYNLLDRL